MKNLYKKFKTWWQTKPVVKPARGKAANPMYEL